MVMNFSQLVYLPNFDVWARPVTITPIASQPNQAAYNARGIFSTVAVDVIAQDGSIMSDQKTILDILEEEFAILPAQLDRISIPAADGLPALGLFEVTDADTNGGGETTLSIRRIKPSLPP